MRGQLQATFDLDTFALLRAVFEEAVAALPAEQRTDDTKTLLASRIMKLAEAGERDASLLRDAALLHTAHSIGGGSGH
jgi:hypothetical protein